MVKYVGEAYQTSFFTSQSQLPILVVSSVIGTAPALDHARAERLLGDVPAQRHNFQIVTLAQR